MAILAACNVVGLLNGYPLWQQTDILPFLHHDPPKAIPSIVNARDVGLLP
jgi:hydroxypyruvate reductase 1